VIRGGQSDDGLPLSRNNGPMVNVLTLNPVVLAVVLSALAAGITIPLTRWSVRRGRNDSTALDGAATLVCGSFIFISAFVMVTVWQSGKTS
jgi:hypothetical protein